jgi:hypothetical protein
VTPRASVKVHRRFGGTYLFHLPGLRTSAVLVVGLAHSSTLMMVAVYSTETWVNFCQTTQRHNSKDSIHRSQHCENHKYRLPSRSLHISQDLKLLFTNPVHDMTLHLHHSKITKPFLI